MLKPHGSCNFLQNQVSVQAGKLYMPNSGTIDLSIKPTLDLDKVSEYTRTQGVPPAMCYYMEEKLTQYSPSQMQDIQNTFKSELANARNIVVIGVRPNPADTHIWNAIANSQGVLWYVGPSREEFLSWASTHRKAKPSQHLSDSFQSSADLVVDLFAKS